MGVRTRTQSASSPAGRARSTRTRRRERREATAEAVAPFSSCAASERVRQADPDLDTLLETVLDEPALGDEDAVVEQVLRRQLDRQRESERFHRDQAHEVELVAPLLLDVGEPE